jgi:hypothetical protein
MWDREKSTGAAERRPLGDDPKRLTALGGTAERRLSPHIPVRLGLDNLFQRHAVADNQGRSLEL